MRNLNSLSFLRPTKFENKTIIKIINKDGTQLLAVVGDAILVYDTATGEMAAKPIRGGLTIIMSFRERNKKWNVFYSGHKENILCIAYSKDGKRFATGGWNNNY